MKSGRLEKVRPDYDSDYMGQVISRLTERLLPHSKEISHLLRELRRCLYEYRLTEIRERQLANDVDTLRAIADHLRGQKP